MGSRKDLLKYFYIIMGIIFVMRKNKSHDKNSITHFRETEAFW